MPHDADRRAHWTSRIRALRRRLIVGAYLDCARGPLVWTGLGAAIALIAARLLHQETAASFTLALWLPAALAIGAARLALRGLPRISEARVRLEEHHHLHSALSAAEEGLAPWPAPVASPAASGLRFRLARWSGAPSFTLLAVLLAVWMPVAADTQTPTPLARPPALDALESLTAEVKQAEWVEPAAADALQEKVEELAAQPPEGWFSQGSLEAAESLLEKAADGLAMTAESLDAATRAVEALGDPSGVLGEQSQLDAANRLATALRGMDPSILPASEAMRRALEAAARDPRSLSPEQMQRLLEAVRNNAAAARALAATGHGMLQLRRETEEQAEQRRARKGSDGAGEPGEGPGSGGIQRGPGTAPITLLDPL